MSTPLRRTDVGAQKITDLERDKVSFQEAEVTAIDTVANTFSVAIPGADDLEGIAAPIQFLPAVGDIVRLTLHGAVPVYLPDRLNAATGTVTLNGLEVTEEPVFEGLTLTDHLAPKVDHVPHWAYSETSGASVTSTELGYIEQTAILQKGRRYAIHSSGYRIDASAAGQQFWVSIRYTTADGETTPATPTVSDTIVTRKPVDIVSSNFVAHSGPLAETFNTPAGTGPVTYRFLITLSRVVGTGSAFIRANNLGDQNSLWFADHGPITDPGSVANTGGGGTVTPAPTEHKLVVDSNWEASWYGSGVKITANSNIYQGYNNANTGNMYSGIGFPSVTATLAGSTVTRVRVYLNAAWWYYDDGGDAVIGAHGYTSEPTGLFGDNGITVASWWTKSGPKWIDFPSSTFANWKSGAYRGVVIGPGGDNDKYYYGYFTPGGVSKMEFTYTR